MKSGHKPTTLRDYKQRLLRVLVQIQQRLDEPLRLADLAATACLAPHHFHHVFTGMLGESLASHIRRLRLERAASRLRMSPRPVIEIALEAGYETHEAFSRAFKSSFGWSPTHYRRHSRRKHLLAAPSGVHFQPGRAVGKFRLIPKPRPPMNIAIKSLPPCRVAFMRHLGPYDQAGAVWDQLSTWLGKEGLLYGDVQFLGICHDDPAVTVPAKIRYDACITVDPAFQPEGEIGVQTLPGGDYAVLTHFGPYKNLGDSYAQLLGQWLPRSGRHLRSTPCFEVYVNSPEGTEPEDLVTDIHAPLE